ncbi:MAG: hypothetical protein Q4C34_08945 [Bacteroidales bacterium]|nr:hypothetical protein [Bacteroidales bacterium]
MRTIFGIIFLLMLGACGGNGNVQSADRPAATAADTMVMLREVGSRYAGADRPDSATLAAMLRLPDIQRRGIPEHIDVIGPNSTISEERIGLLNIATADEIFSGRRRFLELSWPVESTEYIAHDATDGAPDGEPCHITIRYEILTDTLLAVDTIYRHVGEEY